MPLRVAVVARSVYPLHRYGGLERHVFDLVRNLLTRDVRITLIAPPQSRRRPADAQADAVFRHPHVSYDPVPYATFPFANRRGTTVLDRSTAYPLFGLRAGRAAMRAAAAGTIDIVHGLGASALGFALARRDSRPLVPFVFNPQGLEEFGATDPSRARLKRAVYWPLRMAVRRTAASADRVIATDESLVNAVRQHLNVAESAIRVIPNAIELDEWDQGGVADRARDLRARVGLKPDDALLLSVGRLERNKGFDVLVRALARLRQTSVLVGRWRWVLVGAGPQRGDLEREIASSGLGSHVVLWGTTDYEDLHGWYEAATLFVHPTLYEGSSLVTLEAMAHRRAVVASRAGGLPDKVTTGVNGWLVPPGDHAALAGAIHDALRDPWRLITMGRASREIVEERFSWGAATDRLMRLYDELLPRRESV